MKAEGTWLEKLAQRARADLPAKKKAKPEALLATLAKAAPKAPGFEAAIRRAPAPALVAESKRRTPERFIERDLDVGELASEAKAGGAAALLVATEAPLFGGTLDDLSRARASGLPVVRRDGLVDPWQLAESRVAGASGVVLTAAILSAKELGALLRAATGLGLEALVEVRDEAELEAALDAGASQLLVDRRDVRTFAVDAARGDLLLARGRGRGALVLAEGGLDSAGEVRRLVDAGADGVVVGTAVVTAADRAEAVRRLRGA